MRRSTILAAALTTLGALVFCPEVNATEPSVWQYVYPGTKTIVGIDWQRAKSSATGKMISRQLTQTDGFKSTGRGLEMLELIDRVLISTSGRPGAAGQMPNAVIAIQGRLNRETLLKFAPKGTAVQKFKGADLFVPLNAKADETLVALVNEQFAVMGDRESLALVLDGNGAGSAEQELLARATQMSAECEIFVISRESFAEAAGAAADGQAAGMAGMKQLQDIEAVDLGISLAKGLGLKGTITSKDPASAQGLAMAAQLLTTMAMSDPKTANSEMGKIARSLKVSTEGRTIQLSLDIPLAQLEKGVVQMRASAKDFGSKSLESLIGVNPKPGSIPGLRPSASPQLAQASAQPVQPQVQALPKPQAPPVPVRKTIRIVGLDSGDKEVSYQSTGVQR